MCQYTRISSTLTITGQNNIQKRLYSPEQVHRPEVQPGKLLIFVYLLSRLLSRASMANATPSLGTTGTPCIRRQWPQVSEPGAIVTPCKSNLARNENRYVITDRIVTFSILVSSFRFNIKKIRSAIIFAGTIVR